MEITFARHYRGPATSANGGYACGRLSTFFDSDEVEVTLRGDIVLGRMTACVQRVPDADELCVVTSWPVGEDGRKLYAGTALFAADGELLAYARQTWIAPKT